MRKVEAAAEQTAHVPPEVVWSLLSDVMVYPQGPWRKGGYRSDGDAAANGKGAVYWLQGSKRYGFRYPVSVEEVLDVDPGKRLAYTVLRGIPVRNYRAEVTLTPSPDGTLIRWGVSQSRWWHPADMSAQGAVEVRTWYCVGPADAILAHGSSPGSPGLRPVHRLGARRPGCAGPLKPTVAPAGRTIVSHRLDRFRTVGNAQNSRSARLSG